MLRKQILTFLIFASCYLIFSIPFVYSYAVGDFLGPGKKIRMSILEPTLHMMDDLKPVNCKSSGHMSFRMFIENLPPGSNITGIEAYVTDLYYSNSYDISSSIMCTPMTTLISNEEISCHIDVEEMILKIPDCPMERMDNRFDIFLEIRTEGGDLRLYGSKGIIITREGIQPNLRIDFHAVYPPYSEPKINCLTGSVVDVPVVLEHTEVFYGETEWSLRINNSQEFRELIECELANEGVFGPDGKNDIYMCVLTIPDIAFTKCGSGSVSLEIAARNGDYRVSDFFETTTFSRKLNLGLSLDDLDTIECQIIREDGSCIPRNPQQNISVLITGNVPKYIEVFDFIYKLGDENETYTYCERERYNSYECLVFITEDTLPMPTGSGTKTKSRDLNFSVQIKHINYYQTLFEITEVEMEGKVIDEILNTEKVLEKKKGFLQWIKDNDVQGWLEKAFKVIDFISGCCFLLELLLQLTTGALKEALKELLKTYLWGTAEGTVNKIMAIIVSYGPGIITCISEKGIETTEEEMDNLEKFENKEITNTLEVTTIDSLIETYLLECAVTGFWERIKSSWKKWLCGILSLLAIVLTGGAAAVPLSAICGAMENPVVGVIKIALNLLLMLVTYLLIQDIFNEASQAIALAREKINVEIEAGIIMTEYGQAFSETMETLARSFSSKFMMQDLMEPIYDTIKLVFISESTGILGHDDSICKGDRLSIEYNFEKLDQTEDFVSELTIQNSERPFSRILHFPGLKGEYGPYSTESIFRTDPEPENDPSSYYTFTLRYEVDGTERAVNYRLFYDRDCV